MANINTATLKQILQRNEPDPRKVAGIMQDVNLEVQAQEEERANRPPSIKKQFCILLSDTDGILADDDIVGWVVKIPEDDSPASAAERIIRAAYEFNATPKGRLPVETIGEACEIVPARLLTVQDVWVKTKTPVLAVSVNNAIPTEGALKK
ncbi:MAG: hypothetical protein AAF546_00100 [Verrucomicrobiota bacterium]